MSQTGSSGIASRAQVPSLRSFEFDQRAVGAVRSSINLFRGTVALPVDFLSLPGREGLDVRISALYDGTALGQAGVWNVDAPTGILGLAWQMPFESIVVEKSGSGSPVGDVCYLMANGSANPMVRDGQAPDGRLSFQLRNHQFWRVLYDPRTEAWTIVKEDGSVSTYGGKDGDANAVQWGVKWGNWIGASAIRGGQDRYALAWNLASRASVWGHEVRYRYRSVEGKVGSEDGLAFTRASYLERILDSYGRTATFRYGEKYGAQNPSPRGIVEYQARNAARTGPNAYQDRYETLFLDRIDVEGPDGDALTALQLTYDFLNLSATGDPAYPLTWKRCLRSAYSQGPDGRSRPGMVFEYAGAGQPAPASLSSVTYPEGARARYTYKPTLVRAPKRVAIANPLPDSLPGVWYGPDEVVFTYVQPDGAMRAFAYSWNGRWVVEEITQPAMRTARIDEKSLLVSAGGDFLAISYRNRALQRDELYLFRRDPSAFGRYQLFRGQPIPLPLARPDAPASTVIAGSGFVTAYNAAYDGAAFRCFSYDWRTDTWVEPATVPSSSQARAASGVALAAGRSYYIVAFYTERDRRAAFQILYRDPDGVWRAAPAWTNDDLDVAVSEGRLLLTWNAQPSYAVATYVKSSDATKVRYALRVFQWSESFEVLNARRPKVLDLETPVVDGKLRLAPFRTVVVSDLVANNLGNLRDVGGDLRTGDSVNWLAKTLQPARASSDLAFASGADVAVMVETGGGPAATQLLTFDPNVPNDAGWRVSKDLPAGATSATVTGDFLTVGRVVYFRGTDGAWRALQVQLDPLGDDTSVENRAPLYIAYEGGTGAGTRSYVAFLRNGQVLPPQPLPGAPQKIHVPQAESRPGTVLAGPRFLVSYPSDAASFDRAPSMTLHNLDDRDLGDFARLTPVGILEIDDPYAPDAPYAQSIFYANSEQSQIAYDPRSGLAQYPHVFSLPAVRSLAENPPSEQPQGRTESFYSNGLSPQDGLGYPQGWVYNYADQLNGMLLCQREFDAENRRVSSQLNYWKVHTTDAARARRLYGGYVRLLRTTTETDGTRQDSATEYEATTGLDRFVEQTYVDTEGRARRLRAEKRYAWEVAEYAQAFLGQHLLDAVVETTKSVSDDRGQDRTYIESSVTTYRNWATASAEVSCADAATCRLAPERVYQWTTPGTEPPRFDFSGRDLDGWLQTSEIVRRNEPSGVIREQRDLGGLPASFLYDRAQRYLVARFPNGSLAGDEVGYWGFETYESAEGWQLGPGATVVPQAAGETIDAHAGTRSLRLAPRTTGDGGLMRRFQPARTGQPYVFSAWVKKPEGFVNADGEPRFVIAVSVGHELEVAWPEEVGSWSYVRGVVDLPALAPAAPAGSVVVTVRAENRNQRAAVLLDDVRFSPLPCLVEATGYETRGFRPSVSLGANGECSRSVYAASPEPRYQTNAADRTSKLTLPWFSRSAHAAFDPEDPNATLTVEPSEGGDVSTFTRGAEWERTWRAEPAGVWQLGAGTLSQRAAGEAGTLTATGDDAETAAGVSFACLEPAVFPMGARAGGVRAEWDPRQLVWRLLGAGDAPLADPVGWRLFELPADPFRAELDAGVVSAALRQRFLDAGAALPADAAVSEGAVPGETWDLGSPRGGTRYAVGLAGAVLPVSAVPGEWTVVASGRTFVFLAGGRRLFGHVATAALGRPSFFFGSRVAITTLATARAPHVTVVFADAAGSARQTQLLTGARAAVSQTFADVAGRPSVKTKAATVEPTAAAGVLAYRSDFARLDAATGVMTGLVADAYPADGGYPYSRSVFETSAAGRVVEQGLPGADFRVGSGHTARVSYGPNDTGAFGLPEDGFLKTSTVNPNGDRLYQLKSQLGQVVAKVSLRTSAGAPEEIRNFTRFDAAGNAYELLAPNSFAPPPGSEPGDWVLARAFDYAGRVVRSRDGIQGPTESVYDPAGRLRFAQDARGRRDGRFDYWRYDAAGRPLELGDVAGAWDRAELQRLADTDPSWPGDVPGWRRRYAFDGRTDPHGIGRVAAVATNNGGGGTADVSETFAYDVAGNTVSCGQRVEGEGAAAGERAVEYAYDNLGNVVRVVYPQAAGGERLEVAYRYDAYNQVAEMRASPGPEGPLASFEHEANGRPSRETLATAEGGAVVRTFAFEPPLWLSSLRDERAGQALFSETLSYTGGGFDGAAYYDGTIAAAACTREGGAAGPGFRYSYSSLGEVRNAQDPADPGQDLGVVAPVSYDANGNFVDCPQGGRPLRYEYAPRTQQVARVLATDSGASEGAYTYDDVGSVLTSETADAWGPARRLTFGYDAALGLATRVDDAASGTAVALRYDGEGRRVLKEVRRGGSVAERTLYVRGTNPAPLYERTETAEGTVETAYVYGPGGLLAFRRGGRTYLVLKDHLGSVRSVVDDRGAVVARYDYRTFGALAQAVEPSAGFLRYLYTGQELDRELGLYNYRARFYSGELGRFLSEDPRRQFFSPYVYAANNPVLYVDPSGTFSIGSLFSAIAGAIIGAIEILIGVVVDVVAGVLEVVTGGLSTPASLALASLAGAFYGAGITAITYSVFNVQDFSWKDYGIQMGIGALAGALTAGFGVLGAAAAEAATGVEAAVQAGQQVTRVARAASFAIENGISAAGSVATGVLSTTLSDVASGETPGDDLASGALWDSVSEGLGMLIPSPAYKAGWGNLGKRVLAGIAKSEVVGISVAVTRNLTSGEEWNAGLVDTAFGGVLWGGIGGLQAQTATQKSLESFSGFFV